MRYRHPLLQFAKFMEDKLWRNIHKTGWHDLSDKQLIKRMRQEIREIVIAIDAGESPEKIALECADVANFAMMLADNKLRKGKKGSL